MSLKALHEQDLGAFITAVLHQTRGLKLTYVLTSVDDTVGFVMCKQGATIDFINQLNLVHMCLYESFDEVLDFVEHFALESSGSDTVLAVYDTLQGEHTSKSNVLFYLLHRLTELRRCSVYVNVQPPDLGETNAEIRPEDSAFESNKKLRRPTFWMEKWLQTN